MKDDNSKPMYNIDSCLTNVDYQKKNVCHHPSYRTLCNKPIVDRNLLTHNDYLNMLSTPRGFKWKGMTSYYEKMSKDKNYKKTDQWKRYNSQKMDYHGNEMYKLYGSKNTRTDDQQKRYNSQGMSYQRNKIDKIHGSKKTDMQLKRHNLQKLDNQGNEMYKLNGSRKSDDQRKRHNSQNMSYQENKMYKTYDSKKTDVQSKRNYSRKLNNQKNKMNKSKKTKIDDKLKEIYKTNETKKLDKMYQQNMNYEKKITDKNQYNKQSEKGRNDSLNKYSVGTNGKFEKYENKIEQSKKISEKDDLITPNNLETKIQNKTNIIEHEIDDDLKNDNDILTQNEDNSNEQLNKTKEQREADYFFEKKKQLWLQSEKKRKNREEKDNKFKSSIKAKQKAHEEQKLKMEEKKKNWLKRKQILEEKRRRKRTEKEKKELAKLQEEAEKELLKEHARLRKEEETNLRLETLKLEAKRILKEEEMLRNKINKKFALEMSYKIDPCNNALSIIPHIVNNNDEHSISKTGKKRFIEYINNLLENVKLNDQVFDPGNLIEQIIKKEFNITGNEQINLKKKLKAIENNESFHKNINTQIKDIGNKKEKCDLTKNIVFKNHYKFNNIVDNYNLSNKSLIKLYENCVTKKQKIVSRCKTPNVHCYSNISINNIVTHWKNEVTDIIMHIQKRRCDFVQNAKNYKKWEHKVFN